MARLSRSVADTGKKKSEWVEVEEEPSKYVLRDRMVELYWHGVSREVQGLIETLRLWQKGRYADVQSENEVLDTEDINGFKAFVENAVGKIKSEGEYV